MKNMEDTLFRVNRRTGSGPNKKPLTEHLLLTSSCGPRDLLVIKPEAINRSPPKLQCNAQRETGCRLCQDHTVYEEVAKSFTFTGQLKTLCFRLSATVQRKSYRSLNSTEVGGIKLLLCRDTDSISSGYEPRAL